MDTRKGSKPRKKARLTPYDRRRVRREMYQIDRLTDESVAHLAALVEALEQWDILRLGVELPKARHFLSVIELR